MKIKKQIQPMSEIDQEAHAIQMLYEDRGLDFNTVGDYQP